MKDQRILALIELQSVINEKNELYRAYEAVPDRLEELQNKIKESEDKTASAEAAAKEADALESKLRREKKQIEERLLDLQNKLNLVKTTKEYESRQKEIKSQKDRLHEIEHLLEDLAAKKPDLARNIELARKETAEVRDLLSGEINDLIDQQKMFEDQLSTIESREREKRQDVPSSILERVDRLVVLRQGVAIVPINDGSCGGCGIHVSPQTIQVAKRGLDLIQCDRCSSYLYWDDSEID